MPPQREHLLMFTILIPLLLPVLLLACGNINGTLAQAPPPPTSGAVRLTGNVPPADFSSFKPAPPDMILSIRVYLNLRNRQELEQRIQADGNLPPTHRRSIPQEEFDRRYRPLVSDYIAVRNWLSSAGFKILNKPFGEPEFIAFTGSAALVEQTFDLRMVSNGGKYSNIDEPAIPSRFQGIIGTLFLDNTMESGPALLGTHSSALDRLVSNRASPDKSLSSIAPDAHS